jgi:predicted CoA-binding protein
VVAVLDHDLIHRFLDLERVAVVGVSRDRRQLANAIARQLRDGGRTVFAVNDSLEESSTVLDELPAYRTLGEIPDPVEGVVVVVPARRSAEVVRDALALGITKIWLHKGIGPSSVSVDALAAATEAHAEVVPGACPMMFVEPVHGIHRLHRRLAGQAPPRYAA